MKRRANSLPEVQTLILQGSEHGLCLCQTPAVLSSMAMSLPGARSILQVKLMQPLCAASLIGMEHSKQRPSLRGAGRLCTACLTLPPQQVPITTEHAWLSMKSGSTILRFSHEARAKDLQMLMWSL